MSTDPDIDIAPADAADAATLLAIQRSAVRWTAAAAYAPEVIADWAPLPVTAKEAARWAERIASGEELTLIARTTDGHIVGFGALAPAIREVAALHVLPGCGRRGIGGRILAALLDLAERQGFDAVETNASLNAEPFYAAHGFTALARAEHPLRSGRKMPCVRMRRLLRPESAFRP